MGSITVPIPPCGTEACADLLAGMTTAAEHRDVIGMAKGILMAGTTQTQEGAFQMLRAASQRENVKLWKVAERIVAAASTSPDVAESQLVS